MTLSKKLIFHCSQLIQYVTELQTPIWLDGNIDRKGSMQIETTPQNYGMSMGDVWVLYQMNVMKFNALLFFFFFSADQSSRVEVSSYHSNALLSPGGGTGIRIMTRQTPPTSTVRQSIMTQGEAPRRILYQRELKVGSVQCRNMSKDWTCRPEDHERKPIGVEVRSL